MRDETGLVAGRKIGGGKLEFAFSFSHGNHVNPVNPGRSSSMFTVSRNESRTNMDGVGCMNKKSEDANVFPLDILFKIYYSKKVVIFLTI